MFFQRIQKFFKNLGHPESEATVEVWADRILTFFELYEQGDLSPCQLGLLQGNTSLHNELRDLVTEIYVFPSLENTHGLDQGFNLINGLRLGAAPQGLEAPPSSGYSSAYGLPPFSMGNIGNLDGALPPEPSDGSLLNWLPGGLPLHGGPPGGVSLGGPPDSGPLDGWRPAISMFLPHGGARNHYYYYYNASAPAQNNNDQSDSGGMHKALAHEGQLDIQKPKPFSRHNPLQWRIFFVQCLTMFQGKL
ncbi:hypothetical protein C0995_013780 [Termitomyces sp. Mi166|nr:hypothetical protein C0995_013780 [Termitomyces sp. Mi166\